MKPISQPSEHAIRALTYLAQSDAHSFYLAREIAGEIGVPAPFLGKVLQRLVAGGLLESQKGRGGGFRLALSAADVTLHRIIDALEPLDRPRQCFLGQAECSDERACPLHGFWKRACEEFTSVMGGTSLQDLLDFGRERPESGYPLRGP